MRRDTFGALVAARDAVQFIVEDTAGATFEQFMGDRRMRQLVVHNFMVVGEALNRIRRKELEVASRITQLPEIVGMRNALIHGYDRIDYPLVWHTIHVKSPVLRREVETLIEEGIAAGVAPELPH
jgi:uncharacterized protein with HEPN domain